MPGVTGTSQIDQAVRTFLAESRYTLQNKPGVVWGSIRIERLPENQGPSVRIPKYGTITTYALSEGVDMAQAQQISDTLMTLTPAEFGSQTILSDMMLMTVKDEFFRVAGKLHSDSYDRQREQTLSDDLSNYSGTSGSAGTAFALGHLSAGHAAIKYGQPAAAAGRGGEPGPDPISCICTPAQSHSLKKTLAGGVGAAGATQVTPDADKVAFSEQYNVAGTTVKVTVNINKDASDDAVLGIFSKEAQIGVELGPGPSVGKERNESLRAWELNYVGRWARGEYNDSWGVAGTFDSVSPTS